MSIDKAKIHSHFNKRAETYNQSAAWVNDEKLLGKILKLAQVQDGWKILDLATGTGKVAEVLKGKGREVIGIDITPDMFLQNKAVDELIIASAHHMPFASGIFDLIVCRQGLQFMNLDLTYAEIHRVLKQGGSVVLAHLTSYGEEDFQDTYETLRLRNSARVNFFKKIDIPQSLVNFGFTITTIENHPCRENAIAWLDNGAVQEAEIEQAVEVYKSSNQQFKLWHQLEIEGQSIFETMNMQIVKAVKTRC
ncbi:MAG: methyltransferase domain-containing protein [Bdellovibrionales bacterium]|nr:methyltransferase domain-containing protein [Bdellovibrionales bacterium]